MSKHYRDQFEKRFSAFQIPKSEIDRMYERDLDFQMHLQWMAEQALANQQGGVTSSPAGGGAPVGSTPNQTTASSTLVYWQDSLTDTWKFRVFDHGAGTISDEVDTGLDFNDWSSIDTDQVVQFGGWLLKFDNFGTAGVKVFFILASGEVVDIKDGDGSINDGVRNSEFVVQSYYYDDGAGIRLYTFDGTNLRDNYFSGATSISWNSGGGEISKNRAVPFRIDNTTTYISTPSGDLVDVTATAGSPSWYTWNTCFQAEFMACIKENSSTSLYDEVVIFAEDGSVKNTLDLSAYNLNSLNQQGCYGVNNWHGVFEDLSDVNSPWLIIKYNFDTDTFSINDQYLRSSYSNINIIEDFRETVDDFNTSRNNLVVVLENNPSFTTWGDVTDEAAVIWSLGSGGLVSEIVTSGTSYEITFPNMWSDYPALFIFPAGATAGNIEIGVLTATGIDYSNTGQENATCTSISVSNVNNTAAVRFETATNARYEFWRDSLVTTTVVSISSASWHNGGAFIVVDNDVPADSFVFTESSATVTNIPVFSGLLGINDTQDFGSLDGLAIGKLLYYELNGSTNPFQDLYILSDDNFPIAPISGNATSAGNLTLGQTTFTWDYEDPSSSNRIYRQYSLADGSLISEIDTNVTTPDTNSAVYGDRVYIEVNDVSTSTIFLQGPGGTYELVVNSTTVGRTFNDAVWAD